MTRRVAAAVAVVVSVLAAGLLATVWYDDGTAARRGPAVLAPIDGAPDHVQGLGWVRFAALLAVAAALAAVPAVVAAARWWRRPTRPLGEAPQSLRVPADEQLRTAAGWAAGVAAAAAVVTGVAAWRLEGLATPAVPRAALLLAGAALAWALTVTRARVGGPAAVAVAVVLAVLVPVGGPWYAYGRLVEHTTTAALPATTADGPDRPGTVRWTHPALGSIPLGRYVLLRDQVPEQYPRVVVVDAVTGAEQWSYRNADGYLAMSGDPDSGTVVLTVNRDGGYELRAFDLPTGRPLWNRRDGGEVVGRSNRFETDGVRSPAGVLLLLDRKATRLRALDPRTGEQRWTRTVERECAAAAEYVRAGDVLVQTGLCYRTTVPAYRVDSGADAWTATVADEPVYSTGASRPPLVAGGTVVLTTTNGERNTLVGVDRATGAVRWRRDSRPGVLPSTVSAGRFVVTELDARRRLVAIGLDPATGRAAWTTVLPRQPRRSGDEELVAGTDGTRWYLVAGVFPGGPGTTWVTVLDGAGRVAGTADLDGCPRYCDRGQVLPADSAAMTAAGGTLVVLPSRYGLDRNLVGLTG